MSEEQLHAIEEALGFIALYDWQKDFLQRKIIHLPEGRGNGKTTACILRSATAAGLPPLTIRISSHDNEEIVDEWHRNRKYETWYWQSMMGIYEKLKEHGGVPLRQITFVR